MIIMKHRQHNEESSNYLEITIYNKTKEIEQKIANGTASKELLIRYKDIIRIEIKVKNGKLNSNKSQDQLKNKENVRTKELETYYNLEALNTYYSGNSKRIFGTDPFYRIDIAIKIIKDNETIRPTMKEKLCILIELINSDGYTRAKQIWSDTFSSKTFSNHIKKIKELDINPITFDNELNGKAITYETIPNFSLLDNGEIEFIKRNTIKF